ncbi:MULTISPECIES: hypothetical protein [unclassified Moorena]|uniref:tetratricopeptide repeat protein n=1 Tax=unclassified Moorena TaxID=2683338 RepID=UPI0013CAC947|nr:MULTISPECIES: hypothetical protein [unclassified Moorena]NEO21259.1 hypothetical protein [Moorena sp. SIO4A5]NEQ56749.1 hypothetical protein [Moorena sp. SIO4A1]
MQKSSRGGWLTTLGAIAALITTSGIIAGSIWVAVMLIIDPDSIVWINHILPSWARIPQTVPSSAKTFAQIQGEIRENGLTAGTPLSLNSELLLPILGSPPSCQSNCDQIVELRVYQPLEQSHSEQQYYQLVSQLPITAPVEYFVLSTQVNTASGDASVSRSLPLTKLDRFDQQALEEGFWFNLSGQVVSENTPESYGQIIHYNQDQTHLSMMLEWTSPNEGSPYWQEVTGGATPELVVNHTVGLEPQFKVYQIKPRSFVPNPIYLEEISLTQAAIDTKPYQNGLILARHGLWSDAWQWLNQQRPKHWSAEAQAQIDLVKLHAQVTESQANQIWASASAAIFAYLLDGRWAEAKTVFQTAVNGAQLGDIITMLKTDSGGLWGRVEAALEVNPDDSNVQVWGGLILAAQEDPQKAIAWVKELPQTNPQVYQLLNHMDNALNPVPAIVRHFSQLVGNSEIIQTVNATDWLQPEDGDGGIGEQHCQRQQESTELVSIAEEQSIALSPLSPCPSVPLTLQKQPEQVWYQVQVKAFHDGQGWRWMPFSDLRLPTLTKGKRLWRYLGLDVDPQIRISLWSENGIQQSTTATVKGVSYQEGVIKLLAAGGKLPSDTVAIDGSNQHLLAHTETALRWLDPSAITLSALYHLNPESVSTMLPVLWQELINSGQFSPGPLPSLPMMLQEIGHWSVRPIELTGNNQPEAVLTLYQEISVTSESTEVGLSDSINDGMDTDRATTIYKPRTMIFSDTGALLYSEFSQDASSSMTAIADLGDGGPAAIVIDEPNNYSLKRWSPKHQRFQ